ncbi:MlaD family protein [Tenacibaculum sp. SG-28]|uniref:MlaD family protein n=1 Tax=Tenacibaculum sp. SG-28 TaxID=754426 RepID=UPI001E3A2BBA|nr:MlaD family protein [Tenacibaculum sp. SG-28]
MTRELKTGIVAVVIIALFIWGYNFLKGQDIFSANSRYFYVEYNDISGLNVASTVTINGLKVGKVDEILLSSNPSKKGQLLVKITINSDFKFTKNSVAKIYPASLMGGKNIAIIPSYTGVEAVSGDYLNGEVEAI